MYYIYLSIELGVKNVEYAYLQGELKKQKERTSNLREQYLKESSLRTIERKAIEQLLYIHLRDILL